MVVTSIEVDIAAATDVAPVIYLTAGGDAANGVAVFVVGVVRGFRGIFVSLILSSCARLQGGCVTVAECVTAQVEGVVAVVPQFAAVLQVFQLDVEGIGSDVAAVFQGAG